MSASKCTAAAQRWPSRVLSHFHQELESCITKPTWTEMSWYCAWEQALIVAFRPQQPGFVIPKFQDEGHRNLAADQWDQVGESYQPFFWEALKPQPQQSKMFTGCTLWELCESLGSLAHAPPCSHAWIAELKPHKSEKLVQEQMLLHPSGLLSWWLGIQLCPLFVLATCCVTCSSFQAQDVRLESTLRNPSQICCAKSERNNPCKYVVLLHSV